jgi:hypothetical protein
MINRDELRKARPNVETATTRFVRGEIDRREYEKLVERERQRDKQPPGEQTAKGG